MAKTKPIIIPEVPQKEPIHNNNAVNKANNTTVFIWFCIMIIRKGNVFLIFKAVGFLFFLYS